MPSTPVIRTGLPVILIGIAVTFAGCSSSNSNSSGTSGSVTTISGSKPLNTLTSSEWQQLVCTDVPKYVSTQLGSSLNSYLCMTAAAATLAATTVAQCQSTYTNCMSSISSGTSSGNDAGSSCTFSSSTVASCTETVAQFSTCISDDTAAAKTVFDQIAQIGIGICTNPDAGNISNTQTPLPASCTALIQACPSLESYITGATSG